MSTPDRRALLLGGLSAAALVPTTLARAARQADAATERPGATPHTRFAVNVEMWWRRLPFLERLEQAARLGFPAVEFWGLGGKDVPPIAARCRALGLEVAQFTAWGFVPGLNDPANHDAFVTAIERGCESAAELGAKKMTVVAGNDRPGVSQREMHEHVVAGLKRAAPIAERCGTMMILEPMNVRVDHPGHCLFGSPDAVRICREVASPMCKINWDLYHMQISEGDLCGRLREGFAEVGYLQLADHPGRHEPGTGEIFYPRVLREAHELGYRDFVGLECSPAEDELTAARRVHAADTW